MNQLMLVGLIALGGALGSVSRYAVAVGSRHFVGDAFPLGTLLVNVVGCFLIGYLGVVLAGAGFIRDEYRAGLLVGLLGGLTTFSSFGLETIELLAGRSYMAAISNIVLSVALGLVAVATGMRLAAKWPGVN